MPHKRAGSYPTPEQMQKLIDAYEKYTDPEVPMEQRPSQTELGKEYGIPQSTMSAWFTKFDVQGVEAFQEEATEGQAEPDAEGTIPEAPQELDDTPRKLPRDRRTPPPGQDQFSRTAEKTTTREAVKTIGERSKESYARVINIGNVIEDKYGDLVKVALEQGYTLEDFVKEVFGWYERRLEVNRQIQAQDLALAELQELTASNYMFKRESQCILDFAKTCAELNKAGARIPIKQAARALQNDLEKIRMEVKNMFETKTEEMIPNG